MKVHGNEKRISRRENRGRLVLEAMLRRQDGNAGALSAAILFIILISAAYFSFRYYSRAAPNRDARFPAMETRSGGTDAAMETGAAVGPVEAFPSPPEEGLPPAVSEAIREGSYNKAAVLIKSALRDTPSSPGLKSALSAVLNREGVEAYDKGNYPLAAEYFKEAALYSAEPVISRNLANVQIKQNDLDSAIETLKPLGDDAEAGRLLKDIYVRLGNSAYKRGEAEEAAGYYAKALDLDPSDEGLRNTIRSIQAEHKGESSMEKREAEHFRVRFEGGENAATGHLIALLLEEAYAKVGADLGYYPDDKVEAVLYSKEQFRDITSVASWAGAIYDGRIKIPAGGLTERTDLLERVIYHEYTHAVVRKLSRGRAPVWLDEGMAQYEEGKDDARHMDYLRGLARAGKIDLRELEGSFMRFDKDKAQTAYLLGLSATKYLINEFGMGRTKMVLEELGGGASIDSALSSSIYLSYADFERSWADYLKR